MASAYAMIPTTSTAPALLAALTLLAACPDGKEMTTETGTDASTEPTSGGPETMSTTGTPTTAADETSGSGSTTAPPVTPTEGTTEPSTTTTGDTAGDATTGDPSAIEASCTAACAVLVECEAFPDPDMCQQACVDGSMGSPDCEAAAVAFNQCLGGLTCADLRMGVGVCGDAMMTYDMLCED